MEWSSRTEAMARRRGRCGGAAAVHDCVSSEPAIDRGLAVRSLLIGLHILERVGAGRRNWTCSGVVRMDAMDLATVRKA